MSPQVRALRSRFLTAQDKLDLFFSDYSLVPLMVEENYLEVTPANGVDRRSTMHAQCRLLDLLSSTADAFVDADHVDKAVRTQQAWSLLPMLGFHSCVRPSHLMHGQMGCVCVR